MTENNLKQLTFVRPEHVSKQSIELFKNQIRDFYPIIHGVCKKKRTIRIAVAIKHENAVIHRANACSLQLQNLP